MQTFQENSEGARETVNKVKVAGRLPQRQYIKVYIYVYLFTKSSRAQDSLYTFPFSF